MEVSITQFRREIFSLVNQALDGGDLWITHRGHRLRIVPEVRPASRLSRIAPMDILNPETPGLTSSIGNAGVRAERKAETMPEMKKAWEDDWFVL
jgi:antitoxin (DNA-binding transcriptional repressor) of toxin-antitoxin stability system